VGSFFLTNFCRNPEFHTFVIQAKVGLPDEPNPSMYFVNAFCSLTAKIRIAQAIWNRFGLQNKSVSFSPRSGRQMFGLLMIF
jgi:hypothetical protein